MSTVFAQVYHISICCNAKCEKKDIFRDVFFCFYCTVRCNVFSDGRRVFTVGNLIDSFCVIVVFPISSW